MARKSIKRTKPEEIKEGDWVKFVIPGGPGMVVVMIRNGYATVNWYSPAHGYFLKDRLKLGLLRKIGKGLV